MLHPPGRPGTLYAQPMEDEMTKRVAIYLRVSTDGQSCETQRRDLAAVAERHGWDVVAEYEDAGISGAKGRDQRPGFDALLKAVARKDIDMVACWSVDRLGRSLTHLVGFLGELQDKGVDLFLFAQGLDTSTAAGRAMFQMLGVFSEFERCMIKERVRAGVARAKAAGKHLGRPRTVTDSMKSLIRADLRSGGSLRVVAKRYKTSVASVQRVKAAAQA